MRLSQIQPHLLKQHRPKPNPPVRPPIRRDRGIAVARREDRVGARHPVVRPALFHGDETATNIFNRKPSTALRMSYEPTAEAISPTRSSAGVRAGRGLRTCFRYASQRWFGDGIRTHYSKVISLVLCPMSYTCGLHFMAFRCRSRNTRGESPPSVPPAALERSRSMPRHAPEHHVSNREPRREDASGVR